MSRFRKTLYAKIGQVQKFNLMHCSMDARCLFAASVSVLNGVSFLRKSRNPSSTVRGMVFSYRLTLSISLRCAPSREKGQGGATGHSPVPTTGGCLHPVRANDRFAGGPLLWLKRLGACERQVVASPQPDNPYHADIVLPPGVPSKEEQEAHALAKHARWCRKGHSAGSVNTP